MARRSRDGPSFRPWLEGILAFAAIACRVAFAEPSLSPSTATSTNTEEPITPVPEPSGLDPLKVALGERLFNDPRLSEGNKRSCSSCHDIGGNGATANVRDVGADGAMLPLNTPTVFNASLSFRLNWEGTFRTLEGQATATLENPSIMGASVPSVVAKLNADAELAKQFRAVYGDVASAESLLDSLAAFQRSLLTPASRFDRWLAGDETALSAEESKGYRFFKSLGCVSCHQGVNIGGNLFERHGVFHPLASADPAIVRVPSLRNVAATAPYFHDGSSPTLEDAVTKMARSQLNATLTGDEKSALVAYLKTLTGEYRGRRVGSQP